MQINALEAKSKEFLDTISSIRENFSLHDEKISHLTQNLDQSTSLITTINTKLYEFRDTLIADLLENRAYINSMAELADISSDGDNLRNMHRTFSQFGEDQWVMNNLSLPKKGLFIDVGASDGITFSNTYVFEKMGWNGFCFEPDPYNFNKCVKIRKNTLNSAVSKYDGELEFSLSDISPDLSGLEIQNSAKKIKVATIRLDTFCRKEDIQTIDLISVDTEGTEIDVLDPLFSARIFPRVVIVEYLTHSKVNEDLIKYFSKFPYKLVCTTKSNYIFSFSKDESAK